MNRLEGKVAVVTGANSGVGAAIAKLFAAEGATVVMTARREAALEEVSAQIEEAGGKTFVMATDISKPDDPERLMAAVEEKYGKIDVLVNNAGILESGLKPVDRFTDEDLDRIIETNQKGTMRCMRAATKRMKAGASIVNIASVAGEKGCGGAVYVSTRPPPVFAINRPALPGRGHPLQRHLPGHHRDPDGRRHHRGRHGRRHDGRHGHPLQPAHAALHA